MTKKAVILFSGGLDSTTCIAIAKSQGFDCYAISFTYGQKHNVEIESSKKIAKKYGVIEQKIFTLPLDEIRGSSLIDEDKPVEDYNGSNEIPATYVPARNTIFLSFAIAWAEVLGATDIFMGANEMDYSGYPDCRDDYLKAYEQMADLATKRGREGVKLTIHAPLLHLNKSKIVQLGLDLGIDYSETISCYRADKDGRACGKCDSCYYRKKGFTEAGIPDPTRYF